LKIARVTQSQGWVLHMPSPTQAGHFMLAKAIAVERFQSISE